MAARETLSLTAADSGLHRHYFPLAAQTESVSILAVDLERSLSSCDGQLIEGFLRIYRNHLDLLDYGEHDTLTGLLNRKPFAQIFAQRTAPPTRKAARKVQFIGDARKSVAGASEWLAIIDIDHFKRINDRFGHVFGDEVLLLLARLMKASFRSCDTLFRLGGEEFAVLLSGADASGAQTAFEHFRERVAAYAFPQVKGVTVSVGYGRATRAAGAMAAYEQADAALYYAKEHGRNRTCNFESLIAQGDLKMKRASGEIEIF
ncbi:MAG: GGDEF domain-containing protein [Burkholderiaceae bacterium]